MFDFLKSFFDLICSFFVNVFTYVFDFFNQFYDWLADQCENVLTWFYDFWVWTYKYIVDFAQNAVWDNLLSVLNNSELYSYWGQRLFCWCQWANCFFPFSEFMHVIYVLFGVWAVCLVIKIIVKFIPTIY